MKISLSNTAYDALKKIVQIFLPALGTLYFSLGQIFGFPAIEQVSGSIGALALFLGTVLAGASKSYSPVQEIDGEFQVVDTEEDGSQLHFRSVNYDALNTKDLLVFKVNRP